MGQNITNEQGLSPWEVYGIVRDHIQMDPLGKSEECVYIREGCQGTFHKEVTVGIRTRRNMGCWRILPEESVQNLWKPEKAPNRTV